MTVVIWEHSIVLVVFVSHGIRPVMEYLIVLMKLMNRAFVETRLNVCENGHLYIES